MAARPNSDGGHDHDPTERGVDGVGLRTAEGRLAAVCMCYCLLTNQMMAYHIIVEHSTCFGE